MFIHRYMRFHRVVAQRMHHHDIIHIVARPFDPVIKLAQLASGLVVRDGRDPGHVWGFRFGGGAVSAKALGELKPRYLNLEGKR